ncbi:MAG: HAMP domain-containing protein [Ardenticatenaceae bacterium]|nr:HAMP domain-containing protein [Ardenticatenaceae bacterium]MCB9446371.1 HAMP domain-containing protein [Ardenticatenaceae bacterium]
MRSLSLKLTLAFLLVGVIGIALVTVVVRLQTQKEFDQFVLDKYQTDLVEELRDYYQNNGNWDDIQAILVRTPDNRHAGSNWAPVTLLDAERIVIYGGIRHQTGEEVPKRVGDQSVPIEIDGETVGWVIFENFREVNPNLPESPESVFLRNMNRAILYGALGAVVLALLLAALLGRTIARPVQELTEATQIIAQGDLGHQVPVRTQDEIGRLAESFNQMSADLAESVQQRRQMTADIAHDLRTPLSVIMGYTESLSDGKFKGSPDIYRIMHKETQHLNRLIDDLRTLSLADAGELPLTRRLVAPHELLGRIAEAHQVQTQQKNISLTVEAAEDLPLINVDPDRMVQVLGNLVNNAFRFTPEGGEIELTAVSTPLAANEPAPTRILFRVTDNGPGIAPEDLPHIFNRFYKGDSSRQHSSESGLGLAIARSIVEAHGGQIEAASNPGKGTMFTITLPITS